MLRPNPEDAPALVRRPRAFWRHLYFHVLVAILLGIAVGFVAPEAGVVLKPLGDGFIKPIRSCWSW